MKFTHFFFLCTFVILISACTGAAKVPPTQGAAGSTQTAMQPINTPEPAIATTVPLPTATPLPTTLQAIQPATPTPAAPITSSTPTGMPTVEVTTTASPTPIPPAQTATPQGQAGPDSTGCTNLATFAADVTIPDGASFHQGDTFVKTWRIRNVGTCDWGAGYSLVFAGGDAMSAPLSNPLPEISHDSTADISVNLTAPARGGIYQSNWEFQNPDGQRFGVGSPSTGVLWAQIAVSFLDPEQSASSTSMNSTGNDQNSQPSAQNTQNACNAQPDPSVSAKVLALINAARTSQGLKPLESQDQLAAAAQAHSMDMACNNIVSHVGSDGSLWYNRVEAQGYANFTSARENIYVGNPQFGGTAQGAFDWWWNSKVHHDNMLYPDVSQIGIAYVYDQDSEYGGYYTTVFARP